MSSLVGNSIDTLKRKAREAAKARGHTLSDFDRSERFPDRMAFASCIGCGAHLVVDVHPPANGIEIAGQAVSIECVKRKL